MILTASNYGGARHPGWYHNLLANPECQLHIGDRGERFVAHEVTAPSGTGCSHWPSTFTRLCRLRRTD
ncbi:hypothetical protein I552_8832 [Mycobacterium xenopi 3993]|nr:hypothetical protein I552_8832 [Mycobacterium xenopi 3993]